MRRDELVIAIRNWERFQHYKDRDPVWIKDYVAQLTDLNYLRLTLAQRGVLQGLRLMYAQVVDSSNPQHLELNENRSRTLLTTNKGEARHFRSHLKSLSDAGFIVLRASSAASRRLALDLEKEVITSPREASFVGRTGEVFNIDLEHVLRNVPGVTVERLTPSSGITIADVAQAVEDFEHYRPQVRDPDAFIQARSRYHARKRKAQS